MSTEYIIVPGTQTKIFENSIVVLYRLPKVKWIVKLGNYEYNGKRRKGWYFSSLPSGTTMPVFTEDLVALRVVDGPTPRPFPPGPCPPGPPTPPAPLPVIFTPEDKEMIARSTITVDDLEARDKLADSNTIDGKVVRVNDIDGQGTVEYYQWDSTNSTWVPATLGFRYMTRDEIKQELDTCVVDIVWSDSKGALVVTRYDGTDGEVQLAGVVHDPIYNVEDLTLRLPIYGREDFVVVLPNGESVVGVRYEENYERPDGTRGPSLVLTVSDGKQTHEIVGNADGLVDVYTGGTTDTIRVNVSSDHCEITADVKIAEIENNAIQVDSTGLYVDIHNKVDKAEITEGYILVANGDGGFTYGGAGVALYQSGILHDIGDSGVVTANVIEAAIVAAIQASEQRIQNALDEINNRLDDVEARIVGDGPTDKLITSTSTGVQRSEFTIGGDTLSSESINAVATESAVKDAIAWKGI